MTNLTNNACQNYEEVHMVPDIANRDVANYTISHLLEEVPDWFGLRKFIRGVIISMLEDRVRIAMM